MFRSNLLPAKFDGMGHFEESIQTQEPWINLVSGCERPGPAWPEGPFSEQLYFGLGL